MAGDREAGGGSMRVLGVILAGGLSRRMGGCDKGQIQLGSRPLIAHVIGRILPQVDQLVINANGDPARYSSFGLPVVIDTLADHPGPLAGLLAAMRWAEKNAPGVTHVATVPVDTPFLPDNLVARFTDALATAADARIAFATTDAGPQPVFALVDICLADALERDLDVGTARKVMAWFTGHPHVAVRFEEAGAFFNVNTPEDLLVAEQSESSKPPCR